MVPDTKAVTPPQAAIKNITPGAYSKKKEHRSIKKTPAVTIVAACIKADTGVGPSIAIGNQTCNPIWELLAIAPISKQIPIIVIISLFKKGDSENIVE